MSSSVAGPSKALKTKAAAKKTQKYKSKETIDDEDDVGIPSEPKYEGTNTGWDYEPPKGAVLAHHGVDAGEFDYDALKGDENLELWIIRVPNAIKPKHLESLPLDAPSSSVTGRIGSFERRSTQYDVWSLGDDDSSNVGGEEMKNLTCLLPRKKKGGKLYAASSIPIRHLVVSAQASLPTPPESSGGEGSESIITYTNPPRPSYPMEALKHRFMPVGSLVRTSDSDVEDAAVEVMEVDEAPATEVEVAPAKKEKKEKEKEKKANIGEAKPKKRKVDADGDTPAKKSKKVKT